MNEEGKLIGVMVGEDFFAYKQEMDARSIAIRQEGTRVETAVKATYWLTGFGLLVLGVLLMISLGEIEWTTLGPQMNSILEPSAGKGIFFAGLVAWMVALVRGWSAPKKEELHYALDAAGEVIHIPKENITGKIRNTADFIDGDAQSLLDAASVVARTAGHREVMPIHVFIAGMNNKSVQLLFMRLGLSPSTISPALKRRMQETPQGQGFFADEVQEVIGNALRDTITLGAKKVSAITLFHASYKADEYLQELFYDADVTEEELSHVVAWIQVNAELVDRFKAYRKAASFKATGAMNSAYTSVATPFLDSVSEDLTVAGVRGTLPLLVGRDREMNELLRSIEGGGQSVVLVGPPGVGKNTVIAGLAERMIGENVPKILRDKRLLRLSLPHLLGGNGSPADKLLGVFQEAARSGNIIFVIENIHEVTEVGGAGVDLATLIATELEKGYTFIITTTDPQHYTASVERSTLGPKLQKISVEEPARFDAIRVLQSKLGAIENTNKVVFTFDAVAALVDLSSRYLHEQYLPEKAVLLAREVGLAVSKSGEQWKAVKREDVARIVSEKSNVPVTQVTREEKTALLNLEERMAKRMVGQKDAVNAIANALRRARAEIRSGSRPIANFLFLGPTGVGKTELAKTTAEAYFGTEDNMIRFDMSEYQDKSSVTRLIGGNGEPGQLTEAVRTKPFALVLLDELEKAHPDILNLFLQVMDDGRLTDGQGRTIDFTNVILIATSNAGTSYIQEAVAKGESTEQMKEHLMETELKTIYRPEFLNRFDGVMVFKPLTQQDVVAIAYIMMQKVIKQLEVKGIALEVSDKAMHDLAVMGYDPKFGARPLRRTIQDQVENPIAEKLLSEDLRRRDKLILEAPGMVRVEKAAQL